METILRQLFDFQKFSPNASLTDVIQSVHGALDLERELSDDETEIWAAGDVDPSPSAQPEKPYDAR